MNLNIVPYCTILILVIRRLDVFTSYATDSPIQNRNLNVQHNNNNNRVVRAAQATGQDSATINVSDSDEDELELDTSNLNNSAISVNPAGRNVVATTPVVKATTPKSNSISLPDTDYEGPVSMPRPGGATPRARTAVPVAASANVVAAPTARTPVAVAASAPLAAGGAAPAAAQPMARAASAAPQPMARAVPVAAQPGGTPIGSPQAQKSKGISLAYSDFEGPTSMPRPGGMSQAAAAPKPAAVAGAAPVAAMPKPAGMPKVIPSKGPQGLPGAASATKVTVSGQAPGKSKFDDILLSDVEDAMKKNKYDDIPLSDVEDVVKKSKPTDILLSDIETTPKKSKYEDIALSDTEGFDPIGPKGGAKMNMGGAMPKQRAGSLSGSGEFEDVPLDGVSDFGMGSSRGHPPKTKMISRSKAEDIVLSDAGEFEDILVETDNEGADKGPRKLAGFGAAAKAATKPGDAGSIYEVKVQDRGHDHREAQRQPPPMAQRRAYVQPLKLVVDISKKWSTDELEYKRIDNRRMDIFTAIDPHLIYKVKNFDDTLWEAKNGAFVKMVEIETRSDKPPLVTVYLPDEVFPMGGDTTVEIAATIQEDQMSDFSEFSKFAVRQKKISEATKGDLMVTEVRPGGYDSDASIIETKRPKRRTMPGGIVHVVILDVKNKHSSDKITYERQGEFDVFTAVEPYLIDKVQKRNQLIWRSTNMNYASRVIQKKTGSKRNFRIFFPYFTAQCSDSGSEDERIKREVDEHFKQAQIEANLMSKMQAQQAQMYASQPPMFAPAVHTNTFQPNYPAPPHVPPPQLYRHPFMMPPPTGPVHEPFITVQDRYETYTSQPKRGPRPPHHTAHTESPTDHMSEHHGHHPRMHPGRKVGPEVDPNVEIVELYKVEERLLHEESEPESPDFMKHLTLDVENKKTTEFVLFEELEDKTLAFTAKDRFLFGVVKKGERTLWTSKDGRYSKKILMRERENDIPMLRVFLPRLKPASRASQALRVELDINYKFSTNEYDYRIVHENYPQRLIKHTYTTKGGSKFQVVRRSDHVVWRAADDGELSDQVLVIRYPEMNIEQVLINLPDGTARKYTKPERCVNYYRNWVDRGAVPLFSPDTQSVALDISNRYDTHYYQFIKMGDVSTFTARYGYVFTAVFDRRFLVWASTGTEFAVSVEIVGEYDMTIQLCTTNRRFAKAENDVWYEYTDKLEATPIYVRASQYIV
ncbi:hypothetical protein MACK_002219 [Theileria orientalis]|uniref:Uncharacterized protein n=1 Tax=Theileria orientalis TaxID=68886 RepID=A0A976MBU1_THEOR|nr:hypothetical protein MACK_002219 [Theileria orientalis]